jgi:hypothetical protein
MKNTTSTLPGNPGTNNLVPIEVPEVRRNKGNSAVLQMVDRALKAAKSMVQSVQQFEPELNKAAVACVQHFAKCGDMGPADRLYQGLRACGHPVTTTAAAELRVWFKENSPIQWDSKNKVFKNKDEAKGRITTNEQVEEAKGYFETPQALRARSAAERAHGQNLKPVTAKMMINRIIGAGAGFYANIKAGKDQRPIADGEEARIKRIIKAVNTAVMDVAGDDAAEAIKKVA